MGGLIRDAGVPLVWPSTEAPVTHRRLPVVGTVLRASVSSLPDARLSRGRERVLCPIDANLHSRRRHLKELIWRKGKGSHTRQIDSAFEEEGFVDARSHPVKNYLAAEKRHRQAREARWLPCQGVMRRASQPASLLNRDGAERGGFAWLVAARNWARVSLTIVRRDSASKVQERR